MTQHERYGQLGAGHGRLRELRPEVLLRYTHDGSKTTSDAFTLAVNDGAGSSGPTTVHVEVTPVNDAPTGGPVVLTVAEGATVTAKDNGAESLLSGVADAEGDEPTATLLTSPSHGKVTVKPDGSFRYNHDGSESSDDAFTLVAHDGAASSEPIAVTIAVTLENDGITSP